MIDCNHESYTKQTKVRLIFLVLSLWGLASSAFAGEFPIVHQGRAVAIIAIADKPTDSELKAAEDLQKYIERITGVRLAITSKPVAADKPAILIGQTDEVKDLAGKWLTEEHVGWDGFVIRTYRTTKKMAASNTPNRLVLAGREAGTRYAVFQFLYHLGCRFYAPHNDGECIPQQKTLVLPEIARLYKPDFIQRGLCWQNYIPSIDSPEGKYKGAQEDRDAFKYWCIKNAVGGHSIDMGHNFGNILPPTKYFKEHPDWYALAPGKDGKLVRGGTGAPDVPGAQPGRMQLCLSNPEVQRIFIKAACERFGDSKGGTFSLSPADTSAERWCNCQKCRAMDGKGGLAQRLVTFANIVAASVEKKCPGNYFPFYVEYYLPGCPVGDDGTIHVRCHRSLVPTFVNTYCPIHSPYDSSCPESADMQWAMGAWDRVSSQIAIRDYRMWSLFLPNPTTWTIGPRIRFFRDIGAKWYNTEILNRSPDSDLALYVAARMLWDTDQDPDAIIDEFFELYFGEVADEMKAYYKCLDNQYSNIHSHGWVKYGRIINRRTIAELRKALAPAIEQARQPVTKRRVQREALALDIYAAMVDWWLPMKKWKIDKTQTVEVARQIQEATERLDELLKKVDGMQLVAEHCNWWQMARNGALDIIKQSAEPAK